VSYKGTVKNGVVVLPPEAKLPEGATVEVTPLEAGTDDPPFLQAILKLSKPRDCPEDFALNHWLFGRWCRRTRPSDSSVPPLN
jgi:hypothetical protein